MRAVDVVIVTRNTREMTLACVRSVLADREAGADPRCFVVDNGSTDGTADAIAAELPEVIVIRNDHNAAYGRACNQAAALGSAECLLILNSDIIAHPGSIARLTGFLEGSPEHVAAGGRVCNPGGTEVQMGHAARAFPRLGSQIAQMLGLERVWPGNPLSRRAYGLDIDYERTQDIDQPPGSCLIVRRSAFDELGGFDEGFYYWFEDVDLCRRLRERGRIAYVHDAPFEHEKGVTFASWDDAERARSWYRGLFLYYRKHRPRREEIALRAIAAGVALLRALAWLVRDRGRAAAHWRIAGMAVRPPDPAV